MLQHADARQRASVRWRTYPAKGSGDMQRTLHGHV